MQAKEHWERIYATTAPNRVSWFQEHAAASCALVRAAAPERTASIIDVGGGASTLVDDLLAAGYREITVLDLSPAALDAARHRLGEAARRVRWLEASVTEIQFPIHAYDVWHDRAVFHFLTTTEERDAYVRAVMRAVKPGGHVIVATFAEDGPPECSGLPVMRYGPQELLAAFGGSFELVEHVKEDHLTPAGTVQRFVYCHCRLLSTGSSA